MVRSGSFSRGANVMDILPVAKKKEQKKKGEDKELMALCLKPFHNGFDRAVWFVEFVEYYRLMGEGNFWVFICGADQGEVSVVLLVGVGGGLFSS